MDPAKLARRMIPILYQDEAYIIVHKPAGLPVKTPFKARPWGLIDVLRRLLPAQDTLSLIPCNTLERWTSGVLLIARTSEAAEQFTALEKKTAVKKNYVAVVKGVARPATPAPAGTSRRRAIVQVSPKTSPINIKQVRQYDRRTWIRFDYAGREGRPLRAQLARRHPLVGDSEFSRFPNKLQTGRWMLHLESMAFNHPQSHKRIQVKSPAPEAFHQAAKGEIVLTDFLETALARRLPVLIDPSTDTCRLLDGAADGVSGLIVERFGRTLIAQVQQGRIQRTPREVRSATRWFADQMNAESICIKDHPRDRSHQDPLTPSPAASKSSDDEIVVRENDLRFIIRPNDGLSVGLFLDHRETRRRVRDLAADRSVLNTFAYTCAFSIAAASGGATTTVNADISKKALEWGKRNFEANDMPLDSHVFLCADTLDYLKRAKRQERRFGLIILDPPTFARGRKSSRTLQVARDLPHLLLAAADVLDNDGVMVIAVNQLQRSAGWLRRVVTDTLGGDAFRFLHTPSLPPDIADAGRAAKTVIIRRRP